MDPLSVAASVAGLAAAAGKVTKILCAFTAAIEDVPRLARNVVFETEALEAVLSQLNGFLRNTTHPKPGRMSMTTVEQFVTIIAHCVLTFAELEEELDGLGLSFAACAGAQQQQQQQNPTARSEKNGGNGSSSSGMNMWDRVKWAAKQDVLREILADLQQQKLSLSLMIGIWTCKTNLEATKSYEELCRAVEGLKKREESRSQRSSMRRESTVTLKGSRDLHPLRLNKGRLSWSRKSWGDKRRRSSLLSAVSLDQIDDITALPVPLYTNELYNGNLYAAASEAAPQRLHIRPKSVMFSWASGGGGTEGGGGGGGRRSNSQPRRQRSFLRTLSSLWHRFPRVEEQPEIQISGPFDAKHTTHIGVDPDTGKMRIIGEESPETAGARQVGWMV